MPNIDAYLKSCCELSRFCSQDGLIDDHSLQYTVMIETANELFIEVRFDELLVDSAGLKTERIACKGQLHLFLDNQGKIVRTDIL